MPLKKYMAGEKPVYMLAKGYLHQDWEALTECQRQCTGRLGMTIQIEQEAYLTQHPEVKAMLEMFISKMTTTSKRKNILSEACQYFTRPLEVLDSEVRERLSSTSGPYNTADKNPEFKYKDLDLENNLINIIKDYFPPDPWVVKPPKVATPDTVSSEFISLVTSDTTVPTPEPVRTPEPTLSENMFLVVSNTVDKAIYLNVNEYALRYDTAYVELMKAVEAAMEVPVIEIRDDIAMLLYNAYKMFELNILEKERIAAELAWERRMRKKMKRTLRRLDNFRGYETPPTPKSQVSYHESYTKPPPKPCICHPQYHYNRYAKDRFGIYLPRETKFSDRNVTTTPPISIADESSQGPDAADATDDKMDIKSIVSKKFEGHGMEKKTTFEE